jgi:ATP-dependent Zn protease
MNKQRRPFLMPLIYALALPLQSLAAEEPARPHSPAADFLFAVLPFVMMGGILWWFLRRSQRTSSPFMKRSIEYYERSEQHMQKMEQIGERMAAAIEKLAELRARDATARGPSSGN